MGGGGVCTLDDAMTLSCTSLNHWLSKSIDNYDKYSR